MYATTGKFMVIGWKDLKKVLAEISADMLADDKELMVEMILDGTTFPDFSNLSIVQVVSKAELIRNILVESNPEVELFMLRDTFGGMHTLCVKDNDRMVELEEMTNAHLDAIFKSSEDFIREAKEAKADRAAVERSLKPVFVSGPKRDEKGRFASKDGKVLCPSCGYIHNKCPECKTQMNIVVG